MEASVAKNSDRTVLLSVQELIDCDVEYDKGCSGGNPINAFRYALKQACWMLCWSHCILPLFLSDFLFVVNYDVCVGT